MEVVYENPQIYLTTKETEAIHQTMEIIKDLAYEDDDKGIFNVDDGFDSEDLFSMFEVLRHIVEKRAKILDED